eukprot:TRINITY_DN4934_c0_g1_i1.p1 TRINITY_DN4934_c0_g1~~TRINITY_DN4934_c0_g1_i1.p1  ORF type:complete len:319 (-),score=28.62 TRINITY_DN4934_c0_g1_i1:24-980(-)
MTLDQSFDEEEDDWFFASINRYDHLFMYDLELKAEERVKRLALSPSGDRWALLTTTDIGLYASPSSLKPVGFGLPKRDAHLLAGNSISESVESCSFLSEDELVTPASVWRLDQSDLLQRGRDLSFSGICLLNSTKSKILGLSKGSLYSIDLNSDSQLLPSESNIVSAIYGNDDSIPTVLKEDGSVWRGNNMEFQCSPPLGSLPSDMELLSPVHVLLRLNSENVIIHRLTKKGKTLFDLKEKIIHNVILSPSGEYVSFISGDYKIKILSLANSGKEVFVHDGHKCPIVSHSWHPSIGHTIFSVDADKNVQIWKFKSVFS